MTNISIENVGDRKMTAKCKTCGNPEWQEFTCLCEKFEAEDETIGEQLDRYFKPKQKQGCGKRFHVSSYNPTCLQGKLCPECKNQSSVKIALTDKPEENAGAESSSGTQTLSDWVFQFGIRKWVPEDKLKESVKKLMETMDNNKWCMGLQEREFMNEEINKIFGEKLTTQEGFMPGDKIL